MAEENNIERFVEAQEHPWTGYEIALAEIKHGRKMSHWIWYIFPQLRGLSHSRYSHFYGIVDRKEAEAYLVGFPFDVVTMLEVLEHIPDTEAAVRNAV